MLGQLLDGIEALAALERWGTASEAATRLRLTQSAVSKRLAALQQAVGFAVVRPAGRRLELTPDGVALLERARPLLAELRALAMPAAASPTTFSLAMADSIAASWGPAVVAEAMRELWGMGGPERAIKYCELWGTGGPERAIKIELHVHRSVLLIEAVRLGRYHIGLSTDAPGAPDLLRLPLVDEPMALVWPAASPPSTRPSEDRALITIEPGSATWRAIEPALARHHPELLARERLPVESFPAALQMVKAGFGDGLVPVGLLLEGPPSAIAWRCVPGVCRPISLLTRKTVHGLASFQALREALARATEAWFARSAPPE